MENLKKYKIVVNLKKIKKGHYLFGTKKIFAKI